MENNQNEELSENDYGATPNFHDPNNFVKDENNFADVASHQSDEENNYDYENRNSSDGDSENGNYDYENRNSSDLETENIHADRTNFDSNGSENMQNSGRNGCLHDRSDRRCPFSGFPDPDRASRRLFLLDDPNEDDPINDPDYIPNKNLIRKRHSGSFNDINRNQNARKSRRTRVPPSEWWKTTAHMAMIANMIADIEIPNTYVEALKSQHRNHWKQACDNEINSLQKNKTWKLLPLPPGRKAIACKWVFKIKENSDGSIDRFKARLVAKGYSQKYGIDYEETFSPVVKFTSIRVILSIAAKLSMDVQQMDVKTAFLNGDLDEEIYMEQPEGYKCQNAKGENLVCKLQKSLYGVKQAPRQWDITIDTFLKHYKFIQLQSDKCIYMKCMQRNVIIIGLYVDDMIIASKNKIWMQDTKAAL